MRLAIAAIGAIIALTGILYTMIRGLDSYGILMPLGISLLVLSACIPAKSKSKVKHPYVPIQAPPRPPAPQGNRTPYNGTAGVRHAPKTKSKPQATTSAPRSDSNYVDNSYFHTSSNYTHVDTSDNCSSSQNSSSDNSSNYDSGGSCSGGDSGGSSD